MAQIHLVLGVIGSFLIVDSRGKILSSSCFNDYSRDLWITITTFAASLYSVLILFTILYALYKILDNQDEILCGNNKDAINTEKE